MGPLPRSLAPLAGALLAGAWLGAAACGVSHEYETQEFSEPLGQGGLPGVSNDPGAPLLVEVRFPAGGIRLHAGSGETIYRASITSCRLHTAASAQLRPAPGGGDGGHLTVKLEGRHGVFAGFGGEHNEMDLALMAGTPLALDLDLGDGESVLDLENLRVERLHLTAGAGDTRVVFRTPNPGAAGEILVEGTIGDISIDQAGNANAARIDVRGGVGSLDIDLGGAWRRDASVQIEGSVGDVFLKLPGGQTKVRMEVGSPWREDLVAPGLARRDGAFYSDGYESAVRRLDLKIEAGIGRLIILEGEAE